MGPSRQRDKQWSRDISESEGEGARWWATAGAWAGAVKWAIRLRERGEGHEARCACAGPRG